MSNKVLLTGAAGFIGFHTAKSLLNDGYDVLGIDSLNSYYDVHLKEKRLDLLKKYKNFKFKKVDISNLSDLNKIFSYLDWKSILMFLSTNQYLYSIRYNPPIKNTFTKSYFGNIDPEYVPNYEPTSDIYSLNNKLFCSFYTLLKKIRFCECNEIYINKVYDTILFINDSNLFFL